MSEEEIIKGINKVLEIEKNTIHHCSEGLYDFYRIIQGLLGLYNQEKEKNKELEEALEEWINGDRINSVKHISKDKIREKIKEYETTINQNKLMAIKVRQHGFAQETIIQNIIRAKVEILKELLEE